jgi:hypothetical protein
MAWAMARMRGRRQAVGWLVVLYEGRTEEETKRGATASGDTLFNRRRGEQRKGGPGSASAWGQEKVGEGGLHSGQQRMPVGSGPRPVGTGSGAVA